MFKKGRAFSIYKLLSALCVVFFTMHTNFIYGQDLEAVVSKEDEISSLNNQFIQANDDTVRYFVSMQLYYLYINDDTQLALEAAKQAHKYAQQIDLTDKIIMSRLYLGYAYFKQAKFDEALENYSIGLHLYQNSNKTNISRLINFNLGVAYLDLHMYETAEGFLEKAKVEFVNNRNKSLPIYELFRVNLLEGDTTTAVAYLEEFANYIPDNEMALNPDYLFHYAVLSEAYVNLGYFDEARDLLKRVTPYINKHNRRYYRGIINFSRSLLLKNDGDLNGAIEHAMIALDLFELQKENFYLTKSLELLSNLYSQKENFQQAYYYLSKYEVQKNNLLKARQFAIQNRLSDQIHEIEKAEFELNAAEERLKERQIYFSIVLVLFLIALLLAIGAYRLMKLRDESSKEIIRINEEKNHFIGAVSHDLRSPLNSIMALSSLMIDDSESSAKEINEYSSIILNSSKRMEGLISNMLDVNKIETGNAKLILSPTSIKSAVVEIAESIFFLGAEKNIKTDIKIEENLPDVLADYDAVQRVLENLISNAYKFSPKESTVAISAIKEGNQVQVAISDQGPGMSELDRSKLFKKFEKLSASPTGNEKSTGLGLFIVKNLVTEMNGTILVESELGKGTTFKVLFNIA